MAGILVGAGAVLGCGGGASRSGTGGITGTGAMTTGTGGATTTGTGGAMTTGAGGATTTGASGGASASGGATGTGGSPLTGLGGAMVAGGAAPSGSGGAPGNGGASAVGACPSNAMFCADFEDGLIPGHAQFYPAYERASMATYMTVDATVGAHGSGHSLKVTPGTNFSQMLGVELDVSHFWTRAYIRTDVDTSTVTGHDTFVAGVDNTDNGGLPANAGDPNNGIHLRVGEHECQLELNRNTDDKEILSDAVNGNSNYTCSGGVTFAKDTWYCLEVLYDGPNSTIRVFVDDSEVTGLHVTDWGPYAYDMFKFGFENYGGTPRNVWYDDVAIAPEQIHCYPH